MRCFIAIELPREIKDYLFDLQSKIRSRDAKINFVAKSRLHCTLNFLGNVDDNLLKDVKERLSKLKFKKFKVNLENVGVFPNEDSIRVIWIGLKPANKVIELQQKIDGELLDLFKKDQEFNAHLTLGRVKVVRDKKKFLEKLKLEIENKEFEINEFKLMKSVLSKDGPKYFEIEKYTLN
ncbi:MAG: RNA 2',3'-cyclic phosphodiesterase [Nanoarchaeota archaeon]|nr:RNA 2',3'-cyclic phosphodiesterase [Nanoarchaeota archaeon]